MSKTSSLTSMSPLAEKLRPQNLDDILGQNRILGIDSLLRKSIEQNKIPAMIFWGPPGCGKTSLANVIHKTSNKRFKSISAVSSGVKEVKNIIHEARELRNFDKKETILFIDEIHRFNKAQQDALLQAVEEGVVILIGATTENPSFEVNNALLSRCQLILLSPLNDSSLIELAHKALYTHPDGLNCRDIKFSENSLKKIVNQADGDARFLLNQLEWIVANAGNKKIIDSKALEQIQYHKPLRYDKNNDDHYNQISALHKSVRGSDPDAAVYWVHRMIKGGEDPRYVLRRLMRMASEDVGLADPHAIQQAAACRESFDFLGVPEGLLALDQLAIYLAMAPKSNAIELAYFKAEELIQKHGSLPVPREFRNAVNKTGKSLGYGEGYLYDHNSPKAYSGQDHLPKSILNTKIYKPTEFGYEAKIKARLKELDELKEQIKKS